MVRMSGKERMVGVMGSQIVRERGGCTKAETEREPRQESSLQSGIQGRFIEAEWHFERKKVCEW